MPLKINLKNIPVYAAFAAAITLINFAVPSSPLGFGLYFGFLLCGTSVIGSPLIFIAASAAEVNLTYTLVTAFAGIFCAAVCFLYRRYKKNLKWEAAVYFIISLAPYVIFAEWKGLGSGSLNPYILKSVAALATGIFAVFCYKSVYALFFRLMRCRLREDEYASLAVLFAVVGAGLYRIAGEGVYICFAAFIITFFTRLLKSPSSIIVAAVCALPPTVAAYDPTPLTAYVTASLAALLFCNAGRFAVGVAVAPLAAAYSYLRGCYDGAPWICAVLAIALFFCCAAAAIPSDKSLKKWKLRLECKNILDDTKEARTRIKTADKLYRLSELFREIERAFLSLEEGESDDGARERIFLQLKERTCTGCERIKRCKGSAVYGGFKRLIDVGCVKGKVNLIDLPSEVTTVCAYPSEVMNTLNSLLAEYRRYTVEAENAKAGRRMLADQARGVAEVMKGFATELHKNYGDFSEQEEQIKKALAIRGISCPEAQILGEHSEISLILVGKFNPDAVGAALESATGKKYAVKEKLTFDDGKVCLTYSPPPPLDAAFGVAYAVKNGEKVSGDTHSVIKIDERRFLMALSDGMGSGVYAKKVSEAAISLIEAFYRAETPENTVLNTINKLLTFNRDERFACIDIAAVNLETGRADFVKIGSPAGIIMREGGMKILESETLPLGILENLKPAVKTEILKSGDIVVFMSDGITSAFPSSTELYEFLQTFKPLNPQNLADKILSGALERTGGVAKDDMTVVCTRIFTGG